jgi:hypothetical protein
VVVFRYLGSRLATTYLLFCFLSIFVNVGVAADTDKAHLAISVRKCTHKSIRTEEVEIWQRIPWPIGALTLPFVSFGATSCDHDTLSFIPPWAFCQLIEICPIFSHSARSLPFSNNSNACFTVVLMNLAVKTSEFSCLMPIQELQKGSPAKGSFFYTDFPKADLEENSTALRVLSNQSCNSLKQCLLHRFSLLIRLDICLN